MRRLARSAGLLHSRHKRCCSIFPLETLSIRRKKRRCLFPFSFWRWTAAATSAEQQKQRFRTKRHTKTPKPAPQKRFLHGPTTQVPVTSGEPKTLTPRHHLHRSTRGLGSSGPRAGFPSFALLHHGHHPDLPPPAAGRRPLLPLSCSARSRFPTHSPMRLGLPYHKNSGPRSIASPGKGTNPGSPVGSGRVQSSPVQFHRHISL